MTYASTVAADSPVIFLELDETTGTSAADTGSDGTAWTYDSGVTLGAARVIYDSGTSVEAGTSGAAQRTTMPAALTSMRNCTMELWVSGLSGIFPSTGYALQLGDGFGHNSFRWYLIGDTGGAGQWNIYYDTSPSGETVLFGPTNLGAGSYHLVFTVDGTGAAIFYVNGVSVATYPAATVAAVAPTGGCWLGSRLGFQPTPPYLRLDGAAFYATALSSTRVLAHYVAGGPLLRANGATAVTATGVDSTPIRADGVTAVTVTGVDTILSGPAVRVEVKPAGSTVVIATAAVDGISYTTAVSRGSTAVAISADGMLAAEASSSGSTAVSVAATMQWVVSVRADGNTRVVLIHTPDLFGYGGEDGYDPSVVPPLPTGPPIQIGIDLRASCSVLPPPLVLS